MFEPVVDPEAGPVYRGLANAIADAVERGVLRPGDRLPPQRDLAESLGIALTTVTRAYAEAERRGLIRGEVGRGTFVRGEGNRPGGGQGSDPDSGTFDLRTNALLPLPEAANLLERFARATKHGNPSQLLGYAPHGGTARQREAGAGWLSRHGVTTAADRVLVTVGAQHAMAVTFATITDPGDTVLVEGLTYAGMKSLAGLLRLKLKGVPMDGEGADPDALRRTCRAGGVQALYLMPTLQNPTSAVMGEARRAEVADIATEFGIPVVEDDSYGFLLPDLPRLATMSESAFYLTGTSKSLIPSLRIGFMMAPAAMVDRIEAAIGATVYYPSTFLADVAAEWIEDGTADRVTAWKREEVAARQRLAKQRLGRHGYVGHPASPHGWLPLAEPWTARDFVAQAAMRGVRVSPAEDYAVGRDAPPHAVRICLGPVPHRGALDRALQELVSLVDEQPDPTAIIA